MILNGHLSPGGGFSGGAIIGAGLILYLTAFGFEKAEKMFTEKPIKAVCFVALTFYCLAKSYSFFTGANSFGQSYPIRGSRAYFKQRTDPAAQYLCGDGSCVYHVYILCHVS